MLKRVAAALLWFYVGWYAWSVTAWFLGLPELAGPVIGAAIAALLAGDPMHRIWSRPAPTAEPAPMIPVGVPQAS